MYHSKMYLSVTKRNSYTVEYIQNNTSYFGQILYFLKVDMESSCSKYLAVIKRFQKTECMLKLPCHFCQVKEVDKTDLIEVQSIKPMCYFACLANSNRCLI